MNKHIFFLLAFLPTFVFAQFPAPDSLQMSVHYITIDQSDWCDGNLVQGPSYCNLFEWQPPDTAGFTATLTGYRIYHDNQFFLATSANLVDTAGAFWGRFYVTALYENPAGESDSSNVVVITDLPIATHDIPGEHDIDIGFDITQQSLLITNAPLARELRVYNLQGVLLFQTTDVQAIHRLDGLIAGSYVAILQDKAGFFCSKLVLAGY